MMEPHRVRVDPNSEIARLLDEVGETPILLEKNGSLYRLTREEDSSAEYDPEKVQAAIRKTTGSWADIDADKFITDIYRARVPGLHPGSMAVSPDFDEPLPDEFWTESP